MKRLICTIITLLIVLSGCSIEVNKDNMTETSIYDTVLGGVIYIGMEKSKLDEIWGEPAPEGTDYRYDHEISVKFTDGKVSQILAVFSTEGRWITYKQISTGSTVNDLISAYGEPVQKYDLESLGVAYDYSFTRCVNRFVINKEKVSEILIQ